MKTGEPNPPTESVSTSVTVVYACDGNYAPLAAIGAVSVLKHNPGARIVLLGCGLDEGARMLVRSRVEGNGGRFLCLDASEKISELVRKGASRYVSYAVYARLFIPDLLPGNDRVLYLDCDTLVDDDLSGLFRMDMRGRPLALGGDCIPRAYKAFIRHPADRPYYNSGVMLMDPVRWRELGCTKLVLDELDSPAGPNPLGDQDVIVRRLSGMTFPLGPKWNFLSQYFLVSFAGLRRIVGRDGMLPFSIGEYDEARKHAAIYHFSGNTLGRPWFSYSRHPLRDTYRQAAREAGLAEAAEREGRLPVAYRFQAWLHKILPQSLFDWACFGLLRLHVYCTYHV
jgi:lipopolysaccharide biosynthesis glycosyltransferase